MQTQKCTQAKNVADVVATLMMNLAFAMKVYLAVTAALGIVISTVVDLAAFMAAHLLINSFHLLRTRSVRNEKSSAKRLVNNLYVIINASVLYANKNVRSWFQ